MATEPSSVLTEPSDSHVLETVNNFIGFGQYISPSYWLGVVAKAACGTNPWEWVGQQYAGDWQACMRAAGALENLSKFNGTYADSLGEKATPLFASEWDGNAAANAETYFTNLEKLLRDQVAPLKSVADQFMSSTAGILEMADAIKGLMETLTDMLIMAAISAAAAAASSWTIIGGIAGAAATAASIARAVSVWLKIIEFHGYAWNAAQALIGLCGGYLSALQGLKMQPLPNTSYDHPGV